MTTPSTPINDHPNAAGLTASDVADLRGSWQSGSGLAPDMDLSRASVIYELDQTGVAGHYALVQNGLVLCRTRWGHVALHLLRSERLEPGYIRRVLDPSIDPAEVLLNPLARAARARERGTAIAMAREAARLADEQRQSSLDQARARQRVEQALAKPGGLTLSDLYNPEI